LLAVGFVGGGHELWLSGGRRKQEGQPPRIHVNLALSPCDGVSVP
jgi:hypothetical protein